MLRKVISIFLLIVIIGLSFSSVTIAQSNIQCEEVAFTSDLAGFIWRNMGAGAAFFVLDVVLSGLESVPAGGILEPIDQIVDFINNLWWQGIIWAAISSIIGWIAGHLITAGISLNLMIADNPLIIYGGRMMLQIVNLGFIISIVIIGIATILRIQKDAYSADKLLLKLIFSVILINLTIPIAIGITNIGTKITEVMYLTSAPCPGSITNQFTAWHLQSQFNRFLRAEEEEPQLGITSPEEWRNRIGAALSAPIVNLLSLLASTLMSLIAGITFLVLALVLFIRFILLTLLITFSPIMWLGFIFDKLTVPGLKGNVWQAWWDMFIKWNLIGPITILFIGFTSHYLHTIQNTPTSPATDNPLMNVAQLLAVNMISAIGIYISFKASGAIGVLMTAAVASGIGLMAGATQKMIKGRQIKAQTAFDNLSPEDQQTSKAKKLQRKITTLKFASNAAGLKGVGMSSALGQLGIKPKTKEIDEQKIKEDHAHEELKRIKMREAMGMQSSKSDRKALNTTNEDMKNMTESEKLTLARTIQRLNDPSVKNALSPKELIRLNQLNKDLEPMINSNIIKDISGNNAASINALNLKNINTDSLTPAQKQSVVEALRHIKTSGQPLSSSQLTKQNELENIFAQAINENIIKDIAGAANSLEVLSLKNVNIGSLTPAQKQSVVEALRNIRTSAISLSSSQLTKQNELENIFAQAINENIIKDIAGAANSLEVLNLKNINTDSLTPAQKQSVISALRDIRDNVTSLSSAQITKQNELENTFALDIVLDIANSTGPIKDFKMSHINTAKALPQSQKANIESLLNTWQTDPMNLNPAATKNILTKIDIEKKKGNW